MLNIFDSENFQVSVIIEDFLDNLLVSPPEDFNIFSGKLKYFYRKTKIEDFLDDLHVSRLDPKHNL